MRILILIGLVHTKMQQNIVCVFERHCSQKRTRKKYEDSFLHVFLMKAYEEITEKFSNRPKEFYLKKIV